MQLPGVYGPDAALGFTQAGVSCVVFSHISSSKVFHQDDLLAAEIYPANDVLSSTDFWLLGETVKPNSSSFILQFRCW